MCFAKKVGTPHAMCNNLYIPLKRLHKAVKYSRFFLPQAEKYLSLMETGEEQKDALKLF